MSPSDWPMTLLPDARVSAQVRILMSQAYQRSVSDLYDTKMAALCHSAIRPWTERQLTLSDGYLSPSTETQLFDYAPKRRIVQDDGPLLPPSPTILESVRSSLQHCVDAQWRETGTAFDGNSASGSTQAADLLRDWLNVEPPKPRLYNFFTPTGKLYGL